MYLYVFEDGKAALFNKVTDADLNACDMCLVQIFDISGAVIKEYINSEWVNVKIDHSND